MNTLWWARLVYIALLVVVFGVFAVVRLFRNDES
jgi:hypothetical protein